MMSASSKRAQPLSVDQQTQAGTTANPVPGDVNVSTAKEKLRTSGAGPTESAYSSTIDEPAVQDDKQFEKDKQRARFTASNNGENESPHSLPSKLLLFEVAPYRNYGSASNPTQGETKLHKPHENIVISIVLGEIYHPDRYDGKLYLSL
jgi:hypothetical protein